MTIQDLKSKAEAATPGKWHWTWSGDGQPGRVGVSLPCEPVEDCGYLSHCIALTQPEKFDARANAAYIAACDPQTILAICAVVEAAPYAVEVIEMLMFYLKPGTSDCEHATKAANALRLALQGVQR